jgi:hypothetical protein
VDEEADAGDHQDHHGGERVELKGGRGLERPRLDPREKDLDEEPVVGRARGQGEDGQDRDGEGGPHHRGAEERDQFPVRRGGVVTVGVAGAVPPLSVGVLPEEDRALGEQRDRAVDDHPQERERGHEPEILEDPAYHFSTLSSVMSIVSFRR